MNWDAIGAIAELLGAIGVIATLVYLSVQIRQNTKMAQSSETQALADASANLSLTLAENPQLAKLLTNTGNPNQREFDQGELLQITGFFSATLNNIENHYMQYEARVISEDLFRSRVNGLREILKPKFAQKMWDIQKIAVVPGCRDYIDEIVREINSTNDT